MQPTPPLLATGVAVSRRLKVAAAAKLDPPPRPFSGYNERRDLLGFEEEGETSSLQQESRSSAIRIDGNRRSKVAERRRHCLPSCVGFPTSTGCDTTWIL